MLKRTLFSRCTSTTTTTSQKALPKNGIIGISFDVEKTLLSTKGYKLSEHYAFAFQKFNEILRKEATDDSFQQLQPPKWMSENNAKLRNHLLGEAWLRATHERNIARGLVDEEISVQEEEGEEIEFNKNVLCEAYAGRKFPEVVDEFYFLVMKYFFELSGVDESEEHARLVRRFTQYCVHDYWVSREAYCLPDNAEKFEEIIRKFPNLKMFVVSNTDDRCIPAVQMFPMYHNYFKNRNQFVTATTVEWIPPGDPGCIHKDEEDELREMIEGTDAETNTVTVPALKPYPHGIFYCMRKCGIDDHTCASDECARNDDTHSGRVNNHFWLHVGDDAEADGGAAKNSKSLFLLCDGKKGVDFGKVLEVLESSDPLKVSMEATKKLMKHCE